MWQHSFTIFTTFGHLKIRLFIIWFFEITKSLILLVNNRMSLLAKVPNPPPPPPQPNTLKISITAAAQLETSESKNILLDECLWASAWPELQKACYLARVCQNEQPKECKFRIVKAQLQNGPTCGLTALSMLLNGEPSVEELLKTAQELKFTNNGELFSADYLYQLVQIYFKKNDDANYGIQFYKGNLQRNEIRKYLMENACIFVPTACGEFIKANKFEQLFDLTHAASAKVISNKN